MTGTHRTVADDSPDRTTLVVLLAVVVGYPLFRVLVPLPSTGTRLDWWIYWLVVAVGHWSCFALIWWDLGRTGETWGSVGLDLRWIRKYWWIPVLIVALQVTNAVANAQGITKADLRLQEFTNVGERLFMATAGSITAGVVEETIFRGFALTRLQRAFGSAWLGLPLSVLGFVFLHGAPATVSTAFAFAAGGAIFGGAFILMKLRRLEILMCLHALA
jgi:hypothetical protein